MYDVRRWGKWPYYVAIGKRLGLTLGATGRPVSLGPATSAFLIMDLEESTAEPAGFMASVGVHNKQLLATYRERMHQTVWPNLRQLVGFFRINGMVIIYTALGDGPVHPRLRPVGEERVIRHYQPGLFGNTILDAALKEEGIATLFIAGTGTSTTIAHAALGALDYGYRAIVIEDACIDPRPDHHEAILKILGLHAFVQTTERVIADYPWSSWIDSRPVPL